MFLDLVHHILCSGCLDFDFPLLMFQLSQIISVLVDGWQTNLHVSQTYLEEKYLVNLRTPPGANGFGVCESLSKQCNLKQPETSQSFTLGVVANLGESGYDINLECQSDLQWYHKVYL